MSVRARAASSRPSAIDRKSTRLNSSHTVISYAVFCLKKEEQTPLKQIHSDHRYDGELEREGLDGVSDISILIVTGRDIMDSLHTCWLKCQWCEANVS